MPTHSTKDTVHLVEEDLSSISVEDLISTEFLKVGEEVNAVRHYIQKCDLQLSSIANRLAIIERGIYSYKKS